MIPKKKKELIRKWSDMLKSQIDERARAETLTSTWRLIHHMITEERKKGRITKRQESNMIKRLIKPLKEVIQ